MYRPRQEDDAKASPPATPGAGTDGYYGEADGAGDATIATPHHLHSLTEEIVAVATMDGSTLDRTNTHQMKDALERVLGLESALGPDNLSGVTTLYDRVALASATATVDGERAASIASQGAAVHGARSAAVASEDATVDAANAAAIAAKNVPVESPQSAAIACEGGEITGGAHAALLAALTCAVSGERAAVIGSSDTEVQSDDAVAVASDGVLMTGAAADRCLGGGTTAGGSAAGVFGDYLTWVIESDTGTGHFAGGAVSTGLDYAELVENAEPGVLPCASLLTWRAGRAALACDGDDLAGVVSSAPGVLGGDGMAWGGAYARDEFGRRIIGEDGRALRSPAFREDAGRYVPRRKRPAEWTPVALLGQVPVRVDASVVAEAAAGGAVYVVPSLTPGVGRAAARAEAREHDVTIRVLRILADFDNVRGCAVAWCLVR